MVFLEITLAAILSLLHYFSEKFSNKIEKFHDELISFSAGLFITQIFVFLMPEFFEGKNFIGDNIFILLIIGFVSFHISEKFIYQHIKDKNKLMKDLAEVHAIGFFVDHFVVGIAIVFAFQSTNILLGLVIYFALVLHTLSSSISLTHIDTYFKQNQMVNILLSIAPLLGVIFAGLLNPDRTLYYVTFSLVLGALLYVSIRDMLPYRKEGKLAFFVTGFFISLIVAQLVNFFG
ncbi:MAG: hypothetical protein CL944_02415 [Candidatus Diapherotrites archaeon]|uniref:ZIP family metal transporter n=1 Tax=Candidatus Iainarchaeum sp. TaxID=3101447 RepID=A0A2D6LQ32_9ARCH|nr:hypothetical protein [Candidatus Diapherotrites archaeon]